MPRETRPGRHRSPWWHIRRCGWSSRRWPGPIPAGLPRIDGDALRNALGMLRAITPGRLLVVFGCGGNRDRTKRPRMVRAVQEVADHAFATADNPRGEQLEKIFADMREGVVDPSKVTWVDDRRRAISLALDSARAGDSLLIAGKGHEGYQEFADTVIPFDDRQVVRELIAVKTLRS